MKRGPFEILSILLGSDEPPTEFRIFTAGKVDTSKGEFIFDDAAARVVLAAYEQHGADLPIDYDHASLASEVAPDPSQAGKAAGWFNLEMRGGELWAVNVRWTEPAAAALRAKEWRYVSPAFARTKDGRVTRLVNVALTNLPATRRQEPLMAANAKGQTMLTLEEMNKVAEALGLGAEATLDEFLAKIGAMMAPPPADKPAEPPPEDAAAMAAARQMMALSGKPPAETVEEFIRCRAVAANVATEQAKLAADREALVADERDSLVAELVTLKSEMPATAWANPLVATDRAKRKPAAPWDTMPIAQLRDRVAKLRAANGSAPATKSPTPPPASAGAHGLTESELIACKRTGCDPETYAALKAQPPRAS